MEVSLPNAGENVMLRLDGEMDSDAIVTVLTPEVQDALDGIETSGWSYQIISRGSKDHLAFDRYDPFDKPLSETEAVDFLHRWITGDWN